MSTDTREALAALPLLPEPSAHEVFVYGRREKLVTRADVADELACKYRENDPSAGFGGLYTAEQMQAYARAALATQPAQAVPPKVAKTLIAALRDGNFNATNIETAELNAAADWVLGIAPAAPLKDKK